MKKDKEWLLKTLEGVTTTDDYGNEFNGGYEEGLNTAYELALQLDEQRITQEQAWEVLAPRFSMTAEDLERQVLDGFLAMTAEEIELESDKIKKLAEGLKKLHAENEALKAKLDEPEKVVVPQWFDEWYLSMKSQHFNDRYIITQLSPVFFHDTYPDYRKRNDHFNKKQWAYITENFMAMIDAVKDGYEVEKEPLYYVQLLEGKSYLCEEPFGALWFNNNGLLLESSYKGKMRFTEKEIKEHDERYTSFMVEVAE